MAADTAVAVIMQIAQLPVSPGEDSPPLLALGVAAALAEAVGAGGRAAAAALEAVTDTRSAWGWLQRYAPGANGQRGGSQPRATMVCLGGYHGSAAVAAAEVLASSPQISLSRGSELPELSMPPDPSWEAAALRALALLAWYKGSDEGPHPPEHGHLPGAGCGDRGTQRRADGHPVRLRSSLCQRGRPLSGSATPWQQRSGASSRRL